MRTLIDGIENERLAVTDRGLQYGDGLFETIAVRDGGLCLWSEHFVRLSRGADRLGIPCPPEALLLSDCARLADGVSAGVLKLVLTRGSGGRGYRPPESPQPRRILSLYPRPDYPRSFSEQGVAVTFCRTRLGENRLLAGLKHLNRLEQVMARSEWWNPDIAEGLMQDGRGRVIGGTMSNLFLVGEDRLVTPRLDTCGIAGTVRNLVLRRAGEFGLEVLESDLQPEDLTAGRGLFLTNALMGVWPVRRLGEQVMSLESLPTGLILAVREAVWTPE